jgi:hypothetical protein
MFQVGNDRKINEWFVKYKQKKRLKLYCDKVKVETVVAPAEEVLPFSLRLWLDACNYCTFRVLIANSSYFFLM